MDPTMEAFLDLELPRLNEILGGGLERDAVTLAYGPGGSGKTNLCLHAAKIVAAAGKKVAYIDTEGVSMRRLRQVLPEDSMRLVLFHAPTDLDAQVQMLERLERIQDLGLVIVDSLNVHYRLALDSGMEDERSAGQKVFTQVHRLAQFARTKNIPVLMTAQVIGQGEGTMVFGGRVLDHLVKTRLRILRGAGPIRVVTLMKSRHSEEGQVSQFVISEEGIAEPNGVAEMPEVPEDFVTAHELERSSDFDPLP